MTMRAPHIHAIGILPLLALAYASAANAQTASLGRGGASLPGDYHTYSDDQIPARWRHTPGNLRHLVPEPTDPPELEARAKLIEITHPGTVETLHLRVGYKVRLSPASKRNHWSLSLILVSTGVLWPLPGTKRVFYARCPGNAFAQFDRTIVPPPADPEGDLSWQRSEEATIAITVTGPKAAECRGGFDPPRLPNPGRITSSDFGCGISMKVGDSFVMNDETGLCGDNWNVNLQISDTHVLKRIGIDADGIHIGAIGPVIAEVSVPAPITACGHSKVATEPKAMFLVEVK